MPAAAQFLPDVDSVEKERGVELEVCQCPRCGLVQLSGDPVPYYKQVVRAAGFSEEMTQFRKRQFADFIGWFSLEGKKIVEIGCGRGEYLSILAKLNVEAYGVEYSQDAVDHCVKEGLRVARGFLESEKDSLADAPFDGFLMMNFLEHLPDPGSSLTGIGANLAGRAAGLVEVPNFDMILANNLFSEFIGDHLFYFTKETLTSTLSRNGFEVVDCREEWHGYILSARVIKRPPLDLAGFCERQSKLESEVNEYLGRFGANEVAAWGAGHQALAFMALAGLAGKIRYVVDSAPFKQGKYTPATHIPIVSADSLRSAPVKAVIIMAASYSDEVARIIREKFSGKIDLAILRDHGLEYL